MTLSLYREAILVPASFALAVKMVEPLEFFPPHLSACVSKVSVINLNMEREREREREREETANVVICIGPSFMWVWMALQHFSKFLKIVFTKFRIDFEHTQ